MSLPINTIVHGHVLDVLKTFPDECVDTIVTSPPYWPLRNYDLEPQIWGGNSDCEHEWIDHIVGKSRGSSGSSGFERPTRNANAGLYKKVSCFCEKCGAWLGSLGLEPTLNLYLRNLKAVFAECHRVLASHGSLFLNLGDKYFDSSCKINNKDIETIPEDAFYYFNDTRRPINLPVTCLAGIPERMTVLLMDECDYIYRNRLIWRKTNPMPESQKTRFSMDHELILFFVKNRDYYFNQPYEAAAESTLEYYRTSEYPKVGGTKYTSEEARKHLGTSKFSGNKIKPTVDRIKRCVWDFAVGRLPDGTHYAAYPTDLVEPPIAATCPPQVCLACGKPVVPQIEKVPVSGMDGFYKREIVDWIKCDCNAVFRRGIVLDPFMGSGSTAIEAIRQNRDWVGIDLSEDYIEYANTRIESQQKSLDW